MLAILYQRESGPTVRATLALLYTGASLMILVTLSLFGEFDRVDLANGVLLMPGFLFGYWLANRWRRRLAGLGSRGPVLVVSALAALTLIGKSVGVF
jgi:positive regulator of sigma E activity